MQRYPGSIRTHEVPGMGTAPFLPYWCFLGFYASAQVFILSSLYEWMLEFDCIQFFLFFNPIVLYSLGEPFVYICMLQVFLSFFPNEVS